MNTEFIKNNAGVYGGAVYFRYGTLNSHNVQYIQNNAGHGGGLCLSYNKLSSINNDLFTLNKAKYRGGGIYVYGITSYSSILAIVQTTLKHT